MLTLTKDAVTLYDIETSTVWRTMSVRQGEREVQLCYGLGDTVQEYETTDLDGNPIRVVLQIDAPSEYAKPDQGGVYVFLLPAVEAAAVTDDPGRSIEPLPDEPNDDEPEDECGRGDCFGIHRSSEGYRDCDGNSI